MQSDKVPFKDKIAYLLNMAGAEFSEPEQKKLAEACVEFQTMPADEQTSTLFILNNSLDSHAINLNAYPKSGKQQIQPDLLDFIAQTSLQSAGPARDNIVDYMLSRFEIEKQYLKTVERKPPPPQQARPG